MMINKGTEINNLNKKKTKTKNNHDEMEFNKCSQFTVIILKQKRCTTKLSRRLLLSTVSSLSVTLSTKIFTYCMGDPTCSSVTHNGKWTFSEYAFYCSRDTRKKYILREFLHNILNIWPILIFFLRIASQCRLVQFHMQKCHGPQGWERNEKKYYAVENNSGVVALEMLFNLCFWQQSQVQILVKAHA